MKIIKKIFNTFIGKTKKKQKELKEETDEVRQEIVGLKEKKSKLQKQLDKLVKISPLKEDEMEEEGSRGGHKRTQKRKRRRF